MNPYVKGENFRPGPDRYGPEYRERHVERPAMIPGGRTPARGSRELRAEKRNPDVHHRTDCVANQCQHHVRMLASITLNFAELPRERPEDSGHVARERRQARRNTESERSRLMLSMLLIVILAFLLMGAMPTWPHSRSWGYMPSGVLGVLLVVVLILLLLGRI